METIWQDLRFGLRMLAKSPPFTAAVIVTLALGIGANTAIFSVVNAILLRPLNYQHPDQLVMVWEKNMKKGWPALPTSFPNFVDFKTKNNVLDDLAAFADSTFNLTGGDEPERLTGWQVTPNLFQLLGATALAGRAFLPEDGQPGKGRVLMISYGLWQRRFSSNQQIVGKSVSLNGDPYTVVGIMPRDFRFPPTFAATIASSQVTVNNADLWVPLTTDTAPAREARSFLMIGRLKSNTSLQQAQSEMNVVASRLEKEYPAANTDMEVSLIPLHQQVSGDTRVALLDLLAAVCLVLLIACANVTNLLLARAVDRQKEVAICKALGASRFRLIRQLLIESALWGLAGGGLGLLLAFFAVRLFSAWTPGNLPQLRNVGIDSRVLIYTLMISLLTALVIGLAPALQASKPDLQSTLKESGRTFGAGARSNHLLSLLVVAEIALALVLSIASGLLLKSFYRLQHVNPGFNPENLITLDLQLPENKYHERSQQIEFQQRLLQRVGSIPGVRFAGTVNNLPFGGNQANAPFTIDDHPTPNPADRPRAYQRVISSDYIQTMGIAFRSGRPFNDHDTVDASPVAIVNETAARRIWPNEDPIGKRLKRGRLESQNPWLVVVGVVGSASHTSLAVEPQPEVYVPFLQNPDRTLTLVARTAADPGSLIGTVRKEVATLDHDLPAGNIRLMTELISDSVAQPRLYAGLLLVFAAVALLLAAVGTYGVLSYSVMKRRHEIGVRLALGAQPKDIFRLVMGRAIRLLLIGLILGLILSFAATRVMSSLLFGVGTTDPQTFALILLLLFFVGVLASYFPARSAIKVDPLAALRYE
jgi:putative ABC transport system permease protein